MRKGILVSLIIISLFVIYEVFAFSTNLVKPVISPVLVTTKSIKVQTWYETISYLIENPKQTDIVIFNDQLKKMRIGVIETIVLNNNNDERLYKIRLFLDEGGVGFLTIPRSLILGKILPSKILSSQLKSDEQKIKIVLLNTLAPILQKVQKVLSDKPTSLVWNKPQISGQRYFLFSAKGDHNNIALAQHIPYLEYATMVDLSQDSAIRQQIVKIIDQTVTDNQFKFTIVKGTNPLNKSTNSFEFYNDDYVCAGSTSKSTQMMLPYEDNIALSDINIDIGSTYWSLRLACITRQEFESIETFNNQFREDLSSDGGFTSFFVEKVSGDYALIHNTESLFIGKKIKGHWEIIYYNAGDIMTCSELEELNIPAELREGCLQTW